MRPNTVKLNQPNLVVGVVRVGVAAIENHLKEGGISIDMHSLQFSRLEITPLVGVEREVAEFFELNFAQRNLATDLRLLLRVEGEQFDAGADSVLVREELQLAQVNYGGKL